jgi:protein-S-isoprenylcysteine O-methyltransferase Ste14
MFPPAPAAARRRGRATMPPVPRPHYLLFGLIAYVTAIKPMVYLVPFLADRGGGKTVDSGSAGPPAVALAVNLALLAAFAVVHSALARPGGKRLVVRWIPEPLERSFYSLVAGLQMIALLALWRPIPAPVWSVREPAARAALWGLFGLGWLVVVAGLLSLRNTRLFGLAQAWAAARGRTPEQPGLRIRGIYRRIRHPLYAGTLISVWATPGMSAGHALLAAFFTLYILLGIRFEERDLLARHGESYRRYRDAVPALLPWPAPSRRAPDAAAALAARRE